ncbi:hypothetical protein ACLK10_12005 [Escherichia coli]
MVGLANNRIAQQRAATRSYIVYPRINLDKCVGCGRCYVPVTTAVARAMKWSEKTRTPHCNTEKCVGCLALWSRLPVGCIRGSEEYGQRTPGNVVKPETHPAFGTDCRMLSA